MSDSNMKLERKPRDHGISIKSVDGKERKCRYSRKKVNPVKFDKDLLKRSDGLEKETNCDPSEKESKPSLMIDSIAIKKKRGRRVVADLKMLSKNEKMNEQLQQCLSEDAKKKISVILNDIRMLSDVEKMYLYLQLPTGSSFEEDPLKQKGHSNPLGKKADEEGTLAVTWIQSHLEEDPEVSLPKQEVYDEYQSYCEITGNEALCAADFGKVMKQIFPSVKPRRLGTRGNSRYCYSGLKKKLEIKKPSVPDLETEKGNKIFPDETEEVVIAACYVLFEWAEKLLGAKFSSLRMLACHLIDNMLVDNRSVAAFTLLLASSPEQVDKGSSGTVKFDSKSKKSDAQVHLHRKIQEKELIKEQKQKLEEQRSCLVTRNNGKCLQSKKRSMKTRKSKAHSLYNGQMNKSKEGCEIMKCINKNISNDRNPSGRKFEPKNSSESELSSALGNSSDSEKCQSNKLCQGSETTSFFPSVTDPPSGNALGVNECKKKKKTKNKILPNESAPVCISQSLPSFIIVPSLPQVRLAETSKKTSSKSIQKYKRIQPKPCNDLPKPTVMRCRAGSLGSAILKESRAHADGRRSSLALFSSDNVFDENETKAVNESSVLPKESSEGNKVSGEANYLGNDVSDVESVQNSSANNSNQELQCMNSDLKKTCVISSVFTNTASESESKCIEPQVSNGNDNFDDTFGTKRHSEEPALQVVSKKRHLDGALAYEVSSVENFSPWDKDMVVMNVSPAFAQHATDADADSEPGPEGVSIHELESDALIDYLQETAIEKAPDEVKQGYLKEAQESSLPVSGDRKDNGAVISEVSQLSQLRILLEKNLPYSVSKALRSSNEQNSATKKPSVLMHTNDVAENSAYSKRKNSILNNEMCDIFIRNTNPYLSSESTLFSTSSLSESQVSDTGHVSDETVSQNIISDQDILAVMTNPVPSYEKGNSHLENSTSSRLLQNTAVDISSHSPTMCSIQQLYSAVNIEHSSTQTQVPSVPPSPNTRRRAFNFMPISLRHTPVSDGIAISNASSCHSPVLSHPPQSTVSVGVGPSQPPSNAGSPFVSPRSTPVPPSRSRHSSGQSTYSTSRHTPFQNFDSGVSSISSSPFISPQPTPVPLSRLRHNSSHGPAKTVTFSSVNNNQIIHTLSSAIGHGSMRLRHSSGSSGTHAGFSLLSPRSAPLSPLVNENGLGNFNFPVISETRSRHSSGITAAPLSPVSEQASLASSSAHPNERNSATDGSNILNDPFNNGGSSKHFSPGCSSKQTRQRHASSSVIYSKPSMVDSLAQEVHLLMKNGSDCSLVNSELSIRSRSVPLHQMLPNLTSSLTSLQSPEEKFSSGFAHKQAAVFPMLVSNTSACSVPGNSGSLILHCDKSLQPVANDWSSLDGTSDVEMSTARRNLSGLLEAPLGGDDLQTTLEDLRDCDTDFSKFAQELEQLNQSEEGGL